jgi:hypothetical protein
LEVLKYCVNPLVRHRVDPTQPKDYRRVLRFDAVVFCLLTCHEVIAE